MPTSACRRAIAPACAANPWTPRPSPRTGYRQLLKSVEADPEQRWTDAQLLAEGIEPLKLRRWFKQHFGMTFHAWLRTRRLGMALGGIKQGDSIDSAAFDSGYESLSGFRDAFQKSFHITPVAQPTVSRCCSRA